MNKLNEMKDLLISLDEDVESFYNKGRGLSGTTIRKGMQQMKVLAQEVRTDVMETIKKRQAEKKAAKTEE